MGRAVLRALSRDSRKTRSAEHLQGKEAHAARGSRSASVYDTMSVWLDLAALVSAGGSQHATDCVPESRVHIFSGRISFSSDSGSGPLQRSTPGQAVEPLQWDGVWSFGNLGYDGYLDNRTRNNIKQQKQHQQLRHVAQRRHGRGSVGHAAGSRQAMKGMRLTISILKEEYSAMQPKPKCVF